MRKFRLGRRLGSVLLAAAVAVPLAAVASGGSAFGTTYTVPCNGGDPTALIAAINNANATPTTADTINLAASCTYVFTAPDNSGPDGPNALPIITTAITINGNSSTLQRATTGNPGDFRLIDVAGSGKLTTSYLTVTNGSLTDNTSPVGVGAGILNFGNATLKFTKVLDNHVTINDMLAVPIGGGIANIAPGVLNISNSDVSHNSASIPQPPCLCPGSYLGIPLGGGIANSGTTTISSSTVTFNSADASGIITFAFGGGIASGAANAPTVTISSSKLTDNAVEGFTEDGLAVGGGFAGNALNMSSTEVARNTASEAAFNQGVAFGGGIAVTKASNISSSSSIHDNAASGYFYAQSAGGGVGVAQGATLTINSAAIFNNTVGPTGSLPGGGDATGGGIHNAGVLTLNSTRVSGNSAISAGIGGDGLGGGIYNASGGTVKLVNSSVKSNTADSNGGGVYNADSSPTAVSGSVLSITTNTPNNCVNVSGCVG